MPPTPLYFLYGGDLVTIQRMSIKVSKDMHEWLKAEADKRGLNMNAIIIFALEQYKREETVLPQIPAMMEELERQRREK